MLYFIGLGLADESDITVKGLEIVKRASRVYLEAYTSILLVDSQKLESYYGRAVIFADREMVESRGEEILSNAESEDVAFLVVGDPFGYLAPSLTPVSFGQHLLTKGQDSATTHTDLFLRARALSIPTATIHNASILSAIGGATGLQLYNFGQVVSVPFFTSSWRPSSFYDRIKENCSLGLHTLVLLDIKVKEQSIENLIKGRKIWEPPRYMSVRECVEQMLEVEEEKKDGILDEERTMAVGVARVGGATQKVVSGRLKDLRGVDLGGPLQSLVLVGGRRHETEKEVLRDCAVDPEKFERIWEEGRE
ncbi:MAG: hypothetical protein LQ351_001232 [Letrouitia transgressa]|nr:MAG: hypothetical protein LQ351_001232 [Letrouitia transgressa]